MDGLVKAIALGIIRSAAMAAGAWLAHKGYVNDSLATNIEGSLICLGSAGFTIFDKFKVDKQVKVALATPTSTGN